MAMLNNQRVFLSFICGKQENTPKRSEIRTEAP